MDLPGYWMPRPAPEPDAATRAAFDDLLTRAATPGRPAFIDYQLAAPKWQFLCHAADHGGLAMHGSGERSIELFEPRQPSDLTEFGSQKAVYAASDGLWAMFFAIVDRDRYSMSVANACVRLAAPDGSETGPFYVFSVSRQARVQEPWRTGVVYLLPRQDFMQQPPLMLGDIQVRIAQLASLNPVRPLARLEVGPADFPFLSRIRAHDDDRLQEYADAMQSGGPWPDPV